MTSQLMNRMNEKKLMAASYPSPSALGSLTSASLIGSGLLFVLYPALRPFSNEATLGGAAAFASVEWVVSHSLAIVAFILFTLGLLGLFLTLRQTPVVHLAFNGLVLSWLGVGLTLPFYGAEVFGLYAVGQEALRLNNENLLPITEDIRSGFGLILIMIGLLLLAIGCILVAIAVWKSRILSKWSGIPIAAAFLLYLPQYAWSQPLRVGHGFLITIGCVWLGISVWKQAVARKD